MSTDPYDTLAVLPEIRMVFEVGCDYMHETTPILRRIYPDATLHCFDPAPPHAAAVSATQAESRLNATFHNIGLADTSGIYPFWLSSGGCFASSLKRPVATGPHPENVINWSADPSYVFCMKLDDFCAKWNIKSIDLLHMDVQSGEPLVIAGGSHMLKHTRYIFTEHNTDRCYIDEPALSGILALLPGWTAMHVWPYDALLCNDDLCQ